MIVCSSITSHGTYANVYTCVCVCVTECVHVSVCLHPFMYEFLLFYRQPRQLFVLLYVCMCVCVYVCVCVCVDECVHVCMCDNFAERHPWMYDFLLFNQQPGTYVQVCICVYVCVCVNECVYVCVYDFLPFYR